VEPGVFQYRPSYVPPGKTVDDVRAEIASAIRAAAPSYGVFRVEALGGANERLGGTPLSEEGVRALAPIAQIPLPAERKVPQFLLRGTADPLISYDEVKAYADALEKAGQQAVHVEVEGASHAFLDWKPDARTVATFEQYGVPNAEKMKAFFDSVFRP
jgi:pimeloyl-ACP methyl ester carboxylesterase